VKVASLKLMSRFVDVLSDCLLRRLKGYLMVTLVSVTPCMLFVVLQKPTSELMKAIQLGLGHSIGSFTPKPVRDLLYEDFNVVETVSFPRYLSHIVCSFQSVIAWIL